MKQLIVVGVMALFFVLPLAAQTPGANSEANTVEAYMTGDRGTFDYQTESFDWRTKKSYPTVSVMHYSPTGNGSGTIIGFITPKTKIVPQSKDLAGITRNTLHLLHGKEVVVVARVRAIGRGEGRVWYCEELSFFTPGS